MKNGKIHILIAVCGVILVLAMLIVPIGAACADVNDQYVARSNILQFADFTDTTANNYYPTGWGDMFFQNGVAEMVVWNSTSETYTYHGWFMGASSSTPTKAITISQKPYAPSYGLSFPLQYNYGYYLQQMIPAEPSTTYTVGVYGARVHLSTSGMLTNYTYTPFYVGGQILTNASAGLSNTLNMLSNDFIVRIRTYGSGDNRRYRYEMGTYYRTNSTTDDFIIVYYVCLAKGAFDAIPLVPNSIQNYGANQLNDYYNSMIGEYVDAAYSRGYTAGENAGLAGAQTGTFRDLLTSAIDVPISAMTGLFNFDLLGYNVFGLVTTLFTLAIVMFIIRFVK